MFVSFNSLKLANISKFFSILVHYILSENTNTNIYFFFVKYIANEVNPFVLRLSHTPISSSSVRPPIDTNTQAHQTNKETFLSH